MTSVQAAPPLVIHHLRPDRPRATAAAVASHTSPVTYVAPARRVVRTSPARRMLRAHRSAVISKLAPTAPLVRARVLSAAVPVQHHAVKAASPTAKTIAALAASLSKK